MLSFVGQWTLLNGGNMCMTGCTMARSNKRKHAVVFCSLRSLMTLKQWVPAVIVYTFSCERIFIPEIFFRSRVRMRP